MTMRADVDVRLARKEDAPRLVELLELGSLRRGKEDAGRLEDYERAIEEIANTVGAEVFVAVRDGVLVGVVQLITFRHLQEHGGLCAELESMHVHPDVRSEGIGTVLLDHAVARAQELGCYRVQLTSNAARADAHRFYERHGFEATHTGFKRYLGSAG